MIGKYCCRGGQKWLWPLWSQDTKTGSISRRNDLESPKSAISQERIDDMS